MINPFKVEHPLQAQWQLVVNGQDITAKVNNRLIGLRLTDNAGGAADSLTISLSDHDGKLEVPPHNAIIQLSLGTQKGKLIDKGQYYVNATSYDGPPDKVDIEARSQEQKADVLPGKRSKSWNGKTLKEIITDIASINKLKASISPRLAGKRISVHQTDESDFNVLKRLAKNHNAHLNVKQGIVYFIDKDGKNASDQALPTVTIQRDECQNYSYRTEDRDAYTGVRAKWNNTRGSKLVYILEGEPDNPTDLPGTYATEDDARAAAKAELSRLQRGKATLNITLSTARLNIIAGQPLQADGFKKAISEKKWVISTVEHGFDGGSPFVTTVNAEQLD